MALCCGAQRTGKVARRNRNCGHGGNNNQENSLLEERFNGNTTQTMLKVSLEELNNIDGDDRKLSREDSSFV